MEQTKLQSPARHHSKSSLGGGSVLPNLYWSAVSHTQLRHYHSNFVGLPDAQDVKVAQPSTFRYVRQQHELWSVLRAGRLTTASLNAALGFKEPRTASIRGVQQSFGSMTAAYVNLMEPPWQPLQDPAQQADTALEQATLAHNEAARQTLFNAKQPLSSLPAGGLWGSTDQAASQTRKKQVCEQVGLQGEVACRLYWGTVQEGSALHALGQVFPNAIIHEVGMLAAHTLPSTWQHDPRELPPIGASPDGLICHWLPISQSQLGALRLELFGSDTPPTSQIPVTAAAEAAALKLLMSVLNTVHVLGSSSQDTASGTAPVLPESFKHALSLTYTNQDAVHWLASKVLSPECLASTPAASTQGGSAHQQQHQQHAPGSGPFIDSKTGVCWLPWLEVVECKNHSPFKITEQRKGRNGSAVVKYGVREYPPLQQLRPAWLPQLQWHTLAAGAHSCVVISRTPSKGVSVFRVMRDDDYLTLALGIIRCVHVAWSGRGIPPPLDIISSPELSFQHRAAVSATMQLAGQAKLVCTLPGHSNAYGQPKVDLAPGADSNALWQPTRRNR